MASGDGEAPHAGRQPDLHPGPRPRTPMLQLRPRGTRRASGAAAARGGGELRGGAVPARRRGGRPDPALARGGTRPPDRQPPQHAIDPLPPPRPASRHPASPRRAADSRPGSWARPARIKKPGAVSPRRAGGMLRPVSWSGKNARGGERIAREKWECEGEEGLI
uniref:Pco078108b n=1 Tax=Arundo donax TaxID=35708 RepID=A0A0A9GAQ0_ARUDO